MKHPEVVRQLARLQSLFAKIGNLSGNTIDPEIQSHWAKYLCVLCCGFLENSLELILADFAARSSSARVQKYVGQHLKRFQNPGFEKAMQLIASFDTKWREDVEQYSTNFGGKEAFDSLVDNRNNIVHGGMSGITFVRVKDYFERSLKVIERIESNAI